MNIKAKGDIQRLAWNNPDYIMLGDNSFACVHTTVQISKFVAEGIKDFENILDSFKSIVKRQYINSTPSSLIRANSFLPFVISKEILFPFNKEMHSLICFSNDLDFEIVGVYDSKYSANVGSTTNHIMKADVKSLPIQNIKQIDWNTFDSLILGHLDEGFTNEKFMVLQDVINSKFSIPTYRLGYSADMDKVVEDVITYFYDLSE